MFAFRGPIAAHRRPSRLVRPAVAKTTAVALLMAAVALLVPAARASDKPDHELARAALQAGEVLPLAIVLERLKRSHPGQVLELELEREDGRWVYELKLLQADGQLLKLYVDAGTAQVLSVKRKGERRGEARAGGKSDDKPDARSDNKSDGKGDGKGRSPATAAP